MKSGELKLLFAIVCFSQSFKEILCKLSDATKYIFENSTIWIYDTLIIKALLLFTSVL